MTRKWRMWFVGDLCLHGDIERKIIGNTHYDTWAGLRPLLQDEDILVANLECAVSDRGTPHPLKYATLRASPQCIRALDRLDVAILANNHVSDYGEEAAADTRRHLEAAGIATVGYGANLTEAAQPLIVTRDGICVGFLAFSCLSTNGQNYATHQSAGAPPLSFALMKQAIASVRPEIDALIVCVHWGSEDQHYPVPEQVRFAHRAIEWGADAVIGCHPHVIQPFERYRSGCIFYSLGNFLFPDVPYTEIHSDGSSHAGTRMQELRNRQSLVVCFSMNHSEKGRSMHLENTLPVQFDASFIPRPASANDLTVNLEKMNEKFVKLIRYHKRMTEGEHEIMYQTVSRGTEFAHFYTGTPLDCCGDSWLRHRIHGLWQRFARTLHAVT